MSAPAARAGCRKTGHRTVEGSSSIASAVIMNSRGASACRFEFASVIIRRAGTAERGISRCGRSGYGVRYLHGAGSTVRIGRCALGKFGAVSIAPKCWLWGNRDEGHCENYNGRVVLLHRFLGR